MVHVFEAIKSALQRVTVWFRVMCACAILSTCAPRCSAGFACVAFPFPFPCLSRKLQLETRALRARRYSAVHPLAMDAPSGISREAEARILGIISEANKSGRLASGWEAMKQFLLINDLAYMLQVPPTQVGCALENRSGGLVNPSRAHNLGGKIVSQGFVFAKTKNATAFEAPRDKAEYDLVVAANTKLSKLSEGRCPPILEIRYISVGGSHTNLFLRCVIARSFTDVKALADESSCIHGDHFMATQPELNEACTKGLTWLIIKDKANVSGLKSFAQRALNADAREAQHETEIMRIGCIAVPISMVLQHMPVLYDACTCVYIHIYIYMTYVCGVRWCDARARCPLQRARGCWWFTACRPEWRSQIG